MNATYIALIWELIDRTPGLEISLKVRRVMRVRSLTTLSLFGAAAVVALKYPLSALESASVVSSSIYDQNRPGLRSRAMEARRSSCFQHEVRSVADFMRLQRLPFRRPA